MNATWHLLLGPEYKAKYQSLCLCHRMSAADCARFQQNLDTKLQLFLGPRCKLKYQSLCYAIARVQQNVWGLNKTLTQSYSCSWVQSTSWNIRDCVVSWHECSGLWEVWTKPWHKVTAVLGSRVQTEVAEFVLCHSVSAADCVRFQPNLKY